MKDEAKLEKEFLRIGMMEKCGEVVKDHPLHLPSVTKFVNNKCAPFPRKLMECADYTRRLDAALAGANAQFYLKLDLKSRMDALHRVVLWQAWENKYQDGYFADQNCGIVVTGIKRHRLLKEKHSNTIGHIINHLAKGDLALDDVSKDKVWQVFAEFMVEVDDAYLLEPLRRKGLLPKNDADGTRQIEAPEPDDREPGK